MCESISRTAVIDDLRVALPRSKEKAMIFTRSVTIF